MLSPHFERTKDMATALLSDQEINTNPQSDATYDRFQQKQSTQNNMTKSTHGKNVLKLIRQPDILQIYKIEHKKQIQLKRTSPVAEARIGKICYGLIKKKGEKICQYFVEKNYK